MSVLNYCLKFEDHALITSKSYFSHTIYHFIIFQSHKTKSVLKKIFIGTECMYIYKNISLDIGASLLFTTKLYNQTSIQWFAVPDLIGPQFLELKNNMSTLEKALFQEACTLWAMSGGQIAATVYTSSASLAFTSFIEKHIVSIASVERS